jgi:MFS family permease
VRPLVIDFCGIVVALPAIGRDLHSSTTSVAWTVNAFTLGTAGPPVAVGRLGDLPRRRRAMLPSRCSARPRFTCGRARLRGPQVLSCS